MYAWGRGGTYSVRAQAKDANEALSVWSNPHEITIRNQLSDTPSTPTGPSEGSINTSHEFSSSATDPDGDSISIRFSRGDGDTSSWSELAPSGSTIAMSHIWSGVGTYLIRAQTRDEEGAVSEWSSASEFETTRLKWRYRTNSAVRSSPAIGSDGTVYVGSMDGYLYAIWGDSPLANSPWPKYRHDNRNTGRVGGP